MNTIKFVDNTDGMTFEEIKQDQAFTIPEEINCFVKLSDQYQSQNAVSINEEFILRKFERYQLVHKVDLDIRVTPPSK